MKRFTKVLKNLLIIISSLIIILIITSSIYNRIGDSSIKAEIKGLGTRLVGLSYKSEGTEYVKISLCLNDKISFKASTKESCMPKIFFFSSISQIRFFFDPKDDIIIAGKLKGNFIDYEILKGNKLSLQYSELLKDLSSDYEKAEALKLKQNDNHKIKLQYDSLKNKVIPQKELAFVKRHMNYELSADILNDLSRDTVIMYAHQLSENVREHKFGKILLKSIEAWDNTKIGKLAPRFSQTTFTGDQFDLDKLKGKYVVLDFWGSWCWACIADFPKMKEYYKKYDEEFEIVGIACNDTKSAWERAVKKNKLKWINIQSDDVKRMYDIRIFPTKIILDKEGRIVKKIHGESLEFYQTIDSLMNNN